MIRLTIVMLAAALLGVAALSVAHAQEPPAQLSPPAEPATGSISGRVVCARPCRQALVRLSVIAVPTDTPQPFDRAVRRENSDVLDIDDSFFFSGLADGDYFVFALPLPYEPLIPLPETVSVLDTRGDVQTVPALHVTVASGQAVTGVEIAIVRPPGSATGTGSISGRMVFIGSPSDGGIFSNAFFAVPCRHPSAIRL